MEQKRRNEIIGSTRLIARNVVTTVLLIARNGAFPVAFGFRQHFYERVGNGQLPVWVA
jgi:hypothetical protein